jgi:ribosomal protein L37AE/L43A
MKCTFCSKQSEHEFKKERLYFCNSCGEAFRMGFEKGRLYERADMRARFSRKPIKENKE